MGHPKIGHSLVSLLSEIEKLGLKIPNDIREKCYILSKYYMITRHPDTWESGIPEDYFTKKEAETTISNAEDIVR